MLGRASFYLSLATMQDDCGGCTQTQPLVLENDIVHEPGARTAPFNAAPAESGSPQVGRPQVPGQPPGNADAHWRERFAGAELAELNRRANSGSAGGGGLNLGNYSEKLKVDTVEYFRVQGGVPPKASRNRVHVDDSGDVSFTHGTLNLSIGSREHAEYFQSLRPGSRIASFRVPRWFDDLIQESAIPQFGYNRNPANQGGLAPKIVDPNQPGLSLELPPIWSRWLNEVVVPGSGKVQ